MVINASRVWRAAEMRSLYIVADVRKRKSGSPCHFTFLLSSKMPIAERALLVADAIRFHSLSRLYDLESFTSITKDAAEVLVSRDDPWFYTGIPEGSLAFARAALDCGGLSLNGLQELASGTAHALAEHKGELSLNGVMTLSRTAVLELISHHGILSLTGLSASSRVLVESLKHHHKGSVIVRRPVKTSVSPAQVPEEPQGHRSREAATPLSKLAEAEAIDLVRREDDRLFDEVSWARSYVSSDVVPFQLGNVNELTVEAATILGAGPLTQNTLRPGRGFYFTDPPYGWPRPFVSVGPTFIVNGRAPILYYRRLNLDLSGLSALSDAAAAALVQVPEINLDLSGLTALSDTSAALFATKHRGWLVLQGLQDLSPSARAALAGRQKCVLPKHLAG